LKLASIARRSGSVVTVTVAPAGTSNPHFSKKARGFSAIR
jgi:hypothetical protein